jgi:hypothetical protein
MAIPLAFKPDRSWPKRAERKNFGPRVRQQKYVRPGWVR